MYNCPSTGTVSVVGVTAADSTHKRLLIPLLYIITKDREHQDHMQIQVLCQWLWVLRAEGRAWHVLRWVGLLSVGQLQTCSSLFSRDRAVLLAPRLLQCHDRVRQMKPYSVER